VIPEDVFAQVPVLTGTRVRLEPLGPGVLEPYWRMLQEPEALRLTGSHATFTREGVEEWLGGRSRHADRADWAAVRLADGAFLGEAVVFELDPDNESASFRIGLAGPHVYGRGYGTEIVRLVVDHVLDVVRLHRLELEVYDHNPRAQRVYEKCGFRIEGRRRDALLWNGVRHDAVVMAVLRSDSRPPR
jgi:RimJ/RimL family protein N-acetyltransferase